VGKESQIFKSFLAYHIKSLPGRNQVNFFQSFRIEHILSC